MIMLIDCGITGLGHDPLEIDETQISSVQADPARPDEGKSVVTMNNGNWFLVLGTVSEVEASIADAKNE